MKLTILAAALVAGLFALTPGARAQDKAGDKADKPASKPTDAPKQPSKETGPVYVLMKTSAGDIVLELNREKAPISVDNFLKYVDKGFYDGTIFHRVMPNFMVQGGGYTPDMELKKTDPEIKNEWENGLKNTRGTVAMARQGGRPDSATSQFFINVRDNGNLDKPQPDGAAYAVFGRVVDGMDVVDKIKNGETKENPKMRGEKSMPVAPVKIEKVSRLSADEAKKYTDKKS
jgi:peptidyl-prolyl cis-trans isomerase A (cyclophilin A)